MPLSRMCDAAMAFAAVYPWVWSSLTYEYVAVIPSKLCHSVHPSPRPYQDVSPGSPAQQAGLLAHNDYIVAADSVLDDRDDL